MIAKSMIEDAERKVFLKRVQWCGQITVILE